MKLLKKIVRRSTATTTAPSRAVIASNYMREYRDKGYVPSNGVGVGGSKTGEPKPAKIPPKQSFPKQPKPPTLPKKKPFTPSKGGYSHYA